MGIFTKSFFPNTTDSYSCRCTRYLPSHFPQNYSSTVHRSRRISRTLVL